MTRQSAHPPGEADSPEQGAWLRSKIPPALGYRPYRRYWAGAVTSVAGYNLVYFAQLWLAYQLSPSPLFLGLIGVANAGPAFVFTLLGGVYADRLNRKWIIFGSQLILAGLAAIMALLDATGAVRVWHVLVIAVAAGSVSAFDIPARQAFYPGLVERRALTSAVALNASVWQGVRIGAPAAAGFLIALMSTSAVFVIGAVGFGIMASLLMGVRPLQSPEASPEAAEPAGAAGQLAEGLGYVRSRPEFRFLIGMVLFTSFFGGGYLILMPVFAVDILDVGAQGQGVLLAAAGIGGLSATLWISTRSRLRRSGALLAGGAAMSGISLAAFALTAQYVGSYPLAIALMFTTGLFTSTFLITAMASLQAIVPDRLRGRIMALYGISWSVMLLGGFQAGLIANFIGAPLAVTIGGLLVTAFALGPALANRGVLTVDSGGTQSYRLGAKATDQPAD